MINSESNANGLGNSGIGMVTYHKQPSVGIKKIALRDVQNDNRTLMRNHLEDSPALGGRAISDTTKVSGSKRQALECPSSTPYYSSLGKNGVNDHLAYPHRKFESGVGGEKQDNANINTDSHLSSVMHFWPKQQEIPSQQTQIRDSKVYHIPAPTQSHVAHMCFPYGGPSIPQSLGKPANGVSVADSGSCRVDSDIRDSLDIHNQKLGERFLQLQKLLKQCDDSNQNILKLIHLSPAELSRHAVDLEKKAIQLTIEEGKEMKRMKALHIFGKTGSTTTTPLEMSRQQLPKKP